MAGRAAGPELEAPEEAPAILALAAALVAADPGPAHSPATQALAGQFRALGWEALASLLASSACLRMAPADRRRLLAKCAEGLASAGPQETVWVFTCARLALPSDAADTEPASFGGGDGLSELLAELLANGGAAFGALDKLDAPHAAGYMSLLCAPALWARRELHADAHGRAGPLRRLVEALVAQVRVVFVRESCG